MESDVFFPITVGIRSVQSHKGPVLVLMLFCDYLEILDTFWTRGPALSFSTDLANYVASSVFRISEQLVEKFG